MLDPLLWLSHQTIYPKIYWEHEGEKVAGIGCADQVSEVPSFAARYYGGRDFGPRQTTTWDGIPSCQYIRPSVELIEDQEGTRVVINDERVLSSLVFATADWQEEIKQPIGSSYVPSYPEWECHVQERSLKKVVLARCAQFDFEEPLNPYFILSQLTSATRFAFEFQPGIAFIGASPETLYHRKKNQVTSAAIAGTRPRGTPKQELLESTKDRHEFQLVKDEIEAILTSLCSSLETSAETQVLQTATVQHLMHGFHGTLKEGVTDAQLIEALHPTPAVGGLPRKEAMEDIRRRESFDRGWYAAPVGYFSHDEAHALVAIRSALVSNCSLRLFSGAGIVHGSEAHKEWEELDHKISQFIMW